MVLFPHGSIFVLQILDADKDLNQLTEDFEKHRTEILCGYNWYVEVFRKLPQE